MVEVATGTFSGRHFNQATMDQVVIPAAVRIQERFPDAFVRVWYDELEAWGDYNRILLVIDGYEFHIRYYKVWHCRKFNEQDGLTFPTADRLLQHIIKTVAARDDNLLPGV